MRASPTRRTTLRRVVIVASVAGLTVPFAMASGYAAAPRPASRTAIAGSAPAWVSRAHAVGAPAASSRISFHVALPLRNAAETARVAAAVSNSKGADYGHYLTARQFNARFAPTRAQVASVRSYLASRGLAVSGVAQGNRWVSASGTVAQIQRAFGTTVKNYRMNGQTLRASTSALKVSTRIAPLISGITGISQSFAHPTSVPADAPPPASTCSTYWDQHEQVAPLAYGKTSFPTNNCGYSPAQLRTAYGVQSAVSHGNTGKGVTVAIIDAYASATMLADANQYADFQGEPEFAPGQYTETVLGPQDLQDECGPDGWNQEESLDVEAVHGLAPGANVHYVGAPDCDTGIDTAINYVIQNHVANLVSNSYGNTGEDGLGDEVSIENSLFVQAAAQGIGFYFSTGDDGDSTIDGLAHPEPDFPATDPYVTAIGGTSLAVKSNNSYDFETSWGDDIDPINFATSPSSYSTALPGSFIFGGGGGVSALFKEPLYQKLDVPNSLAKLNGSTAMRVIPDVADVGDPETGYLIDFRGGLGTIGGTSLACPVFVGIQALASQGRRFPIGFANPLLYVLGATGLTFHDVKAPASPVAMMTTSGHTLITDGQDSSLTSTKGYDDTTGLGTPIGAALLIAEHLL